MKNVPRTHLCLYGLLVEVSGAIDVDLPGVRPVSSAPPDVFMSLSAVHEAVRTDDSWQHFYDCRDPDDHGAPEFKAYRHGQTGAVRLIYTDGFTFSIDRAGQHVDVQWPSGQDPAELTPTLLGPVMGVLLRMRGTSCLHASAVVIDGFAVGLVGESGAGKSTTAAAFARLGYPVLCDDVLALKEDGNEVLAIPAYPRIRLWPESTSGLFGTVDALPRMTPSWDKRVLSLESSDFRFQAEPVRLGALVFLQTRGRVPVNHPAPMPSAKALIQLVSDSFATNFQTKQERAKEFELLGRLVQSVPLLQISAPADIERIDTFCDAIVRYVKQ